MSVKVIVNIRLEILLKLQRSGSIEDKRADKCIRNCCLQENIYLSRTSLVEGP